MIGRRHLSRAALLVVAALLAIPALAQSPGPAQQPVKPFPGPHISGTVIFWNGNRMDVKTPDGKTQQVAVSAKSERQVEIKQGAEVTVDYYRKIGKFIIARRVGPLEKNQPAAAQAAQSLTGKVVSSTSAALVLRTGAGDVDLFLSPSTKIEVKSLAPGNMVTVEYQTVANGSKLATRVLPAGAEGSPRPVAGRTGYPG
jgi:RNase P/RNase MRP subunit p29